MGLPREKYYICLLNQYIVNISSLARGLFKVIHFLLFLIFYHYQFCQSLSTVNPKTHFKPILKRKESRLTGCQILVLKASKANRTINNPFLRRNIGFSENTELVKDIKVSLNEAQVTGNGRRPIKFNKLQPGNQTLIIENSNFKLPLNFALKWEEEMLVLILLPKEGKSPIGALLKPKKVLATVEFRQMLADLQNWQSKTSQIAKLNINPVDLISDNYRDKIGKKEDFVDYLTIWKKRLEKLEIKSYIMRSVKQKSRLNIEVVGYEKKSSWTK